MNTSNYHKFLFLDYITSNQFESIFTPSTSTSSPTRLWITKIWDLAKYHNSHSSKSIRVTKLSFGQTDLPRRTPFWQQKSLVSLIRGHLIFSWSVKLLLILYKFHKNSFADRNTCHSFRISKELYGSQRISKEFPK